MDYYNYQDYNAQGFQQLRIILQSHLGYFFEITHPMMRNLCAGLTFEGPVCIQAVVGKTERFLYYFTSPCYIQP